MPVAGALPFLSAAGAGLCSALWQGFIECMQLVSFEWAVLSLQALHHAATGSRPRAQPSALATLTQSLYNRSAAPVFAMDGV